MKQTIRFIVLVVSFNFCLSCNGQKTSHIDSQDKYETKRIDMVKHQIEQRGIKDRLVLNAMKKVPRHQFVPAYLKSAAYLDRPLPIGKNQTISQPYIVAFMTEQLGLKGGEKILEIGTGSGYQAAILSEIVKEVFTIEIIATLGLQAKEKFESMGYKNIHVKIGDGYQGLPDEAPFDGIIVTAAPGHIPQPLIDQLKIGGKMIIPVGINYQELILITKDKNNKIKKKPVLPVRFVPMTGEAEKKDKKN